jgi:hypothetical protein
MVKVADLNHEKTVRSSKGAALLLNPSGVSDSAPSGTAEGCGEDFSHKILDCGGVCCIFLKSRRSILKNDRGEYYFLLIGYPSVSVTRLNAAISCRVTGPGFPLPMTRPSHQVIGATSAAVPVQISSSAV